MSDKLNLQGDDWELQLQRALAELPAEEAPPGLRRRLKRIPGQQRKMLQPWWRQPAWGLSLLVVPALLAGLLYREQQQQQQLELELALAQRDLAVALTYLDRANRQAGKAVIVTVERGVSRPVNESTYRVLRDNLKITQEL